MKLNKFDVVKNQMSPNWGKVDLPETIKIGGEKDKNCYVVAIIDRLHDAKSETYETIVRLVKYRLEAYISMKDHFGRAGIKNMFILHDPTVISKEKKEIKTLNFTVGDAIQLINEVSSIEELDFLTEDDTRKSISKAINEKVEELKGL